MSSLLIARVILLREVNGTVFRRGRLRRICYGSAVWFIAILSGLPVLPFQLIIVSNVRIHGHDFYHAAVGL